MRRPLAARQCRKTRHRSGQNRRRRRFGRRAFGDDDRLLFRCARARRKGRPRRNQQPRSSGGRPLRPDRFNRRFCQVEGRRDSIYEWQDDRPGAGSISARVADRARDEGRPADADSAWFARLDRSNPSGRPARRKAREGRSGLRTRSGGGLAAHDGPGGQRQPPLHGQDVRVLRRAPGRTAETSSNQK